jgi:alpha-beta hydrolase superfamily lysophospholipase
MMDRSLEAARKAFEAHYRRQLGDKAVEQLEADQEQVRQVAVTSPLLKEGNHPSLLLHEGVTADAIVLVHGLTDSPYYMEAIGRRFFKAGLNVVLPLLPAHGLRDPDKAMEDSRLSKKWRQEVDRATEIAHLLGERVSIGGLSTGGALSVNQALRRPGKIDGGLFLFSAALNVGMMNEIAGKSKIIAPLLTRHRDGRYAGSGPNPYKYPKFSQYGGYQLIQIIHENNRLYEQTELRQPVFAAHSIDDTEAQIKGILELFTIHKGNRLALVISNDPPVSHASVVLEKDIQLVESEEALPADKVPRANPHFDGMMDVAVSFFNGYVRTGR